MQRVLRASVTVEGRQVSSIEKGLLILLGVEQGDTSAELEWCVQKIAGLRIFPDNEDKMNCSVQDIGGEVLVVSQFTLCADIEKGRRPSFIGAEAPEPAKKMYESFVDRLRGLGVRAATGVFAAKMSVSLVNEGPVTIWIDKKGKLPGSPV